MVPLTLADPGEVAVTGHWPGPSNCKVFWLITQGPFSESTTVAPEADEAVSAMLLPARRETGTPGLHGAPPAGATLIESEGRGG